MLRREATRRAYLPVHITLCLLILGAARSEAVMVIDNGIAPRNPANVIDTLIRESVFVQNANSRDRRQLR
jgi:hypothetical protein